MNVNLKTGAPTANSLVERVGKGMAPRKGGVSGGTRHPAAFTRDDQDEPVKVPKWIDTSRNSLNSPGNVNMPGRFTRNSLDDGNDEPASLMKAGNGERREKANGISGSTRHPAAFTESKPFDFERVGKGIGNLGKNISGILPALGPGVNELTQSGLFGAIPQVVSYGRKPFSYDEEVEHDAANFVSRAADKDEVQGGSTNDPFYGYYGNIEPDNIYSNIPEAVNAKGSIAGDADRISSMRDGHKGMTDEEWDRYSSSEVGGHTVHPGAKPSDAHHPTNAAVQDFGEVIDDGTSYNYEHVTSPWISGQELQRQQRAGLIDMRYEDIDPLAVYNKIELQYEYGYHPFAPDDAARARYAVAEAQFLGNGVPNGIMQSRRTLGEAAGHDFTIAIDGEQVSGRDFQNQSVAYLNQIGLDDPTKPLEDGSSYTMYVPLYRYTDIAGNEMFAFGEPTITPHSNGEAYTVTFPDGGTSVVDNSQFDKNDYFGQRRLVPVTDPESFDFSDMRENGQVLYMRDMVLPDGTRLRWDQVMDLLGDEDYEGGHVTNDYGIGSGSNIAYDGYNTFLDTPLNGGTEFVSDGEFHVDAGTLPMLYDMFATSAPIMVPAPTNYIWAINQAVGESPYGIDTFSYNGDNHTYQLTHPVLDSKGNMTSGAEYPELLANYMITAGFPVTEYIAGGIGGGPIKKFVANRWKHSPLRHYGADVGGEAVEEMIGNVPEEYQAYGPRYAFANENDETDLRGRPVRDKETEAIDRFGNYWDFEDLANAALGGATMGAVMSAPHLSPRNLIANAVARERERANNERAQLRPEYSDEGR